MGKKKVYDANDLVYLKGYDKDENLSEKLDRKIIDSDLYNSTEVNKDYILKQIFQRISNLDEEMDSLKDTINKNMILSYNENEYFNSEMERELSYSRKILELKDGWDGEHSRGYMEKTWNKMFNFLEIFSKEYRCITNYFLSKPFIDPGLDGGIDLHWKTNKFELLLTIPEKDNEPLSYYGDDYKSNIIKGTLELDNYRVLLSWIKIFQ